MAHSVKSIQYDSVILDNITYNYDPRIDETKQYNGWKAAREYVKELGLQYINVRCGKRYYIFTN